MRALVDLIRLPTWPPWSLVTLVFAQRRRCRALANGFHRTREKALNNSLFSCIPRLKKNMPTQGHQQSLACPSVPSCKPLDRIDAVSHDQQTPLQTHVAFPWDSCYSWKDNGHLRVLDASKTQTEPVSVTSRMSAWCGMQKILNADFHQGTNMFQLNLSRIHLFKSL